MKYNGFYFALFRGSMKKVLAGHYGRRTGKTNNDGEEELR